MPPPPLPDYFLAVELLVKSENAAQFETLMGQLLIDNIVFKEWSLRLALRSVEPYPYVGMERYALDKCKRNFEAFGLPLPGGGADERATQLYHRYVHLWDLRNPIDIAEVMRKLGEDNTYLKLNGLVEREIQDVLFWVATDNVPPPPLQCPTDKDVIFLRVQRKFSSSELGEYLFSVIPVVVALETTGKWTTMGILRHATGPLNFVTEFYKTTTNNLNTMPHTREAYEKILATANPPIHENDLENVTKGMHQEYRYPMIVPSYAEYAQRSSAKPVVLGLRAVTSASAVAEATVRAKSWKSR